MKRLIQFFIVIASSFNLMSCAGKVETISNLKITHNIEFGGVYVITSLNEFLNKGYKLGDSINVTFSNGTRFENIPLSDSYCSKIGEPVFCFYPTYQYPAFSINCGEDLFETYHLSEDDTLSVSLFKKDGYKDIHEAFSKKYSNNREDFSSDEVFANFRMVSQGNVKDKTLFRGASPVDNSNSRAETVNSMFRKYGIENVLDLSNNDTQLENYYNDSKTNSTWKELYSKGHVCSLKISASFPSESYYPQMKKMAEFILSHEGNFYVHCAEGKDRTGFVCILLEALVGNSVKELEEDYMLSYKNYFNVTKETNPASYNAFLNLRFIAMINFISQTSDGLNTSTDKLILGAKTYLYKCGLTNGQVESLKNKLSK